MTVIEADGEAIVIDAGLAFPRDEHLGVDLILPDFSYLVDRDRPVRAVLLTHGHEDHVGALPYLLREARVQEVWATRLTLGLIKSKLDEHGLLRSTELREADPEGEPVEIGPFKAEFIRVAHSIPDAVAIVLDTPGGRILHTGDYKLDHTPVDGLRTDVGRLAELGNRGVDLFLGDSTNAERPGVTGSERLVGEAFRQLIPHAHRPDPGRLLRLERPPHAAGGRRGGRGRPQGLRRRALDAQEHQHRAEPRLHRRPGRRADPAEGARRLRARRRADPLHRQPGRAALGARADRLRRPPRRHGRGRRHGDHLGQAGARERAGASTTRSTSWPRTAPRCCTRRSRRCTSPATATPRSCARCSGSCGRSR